MGANRSCSRATCDKQGQWKMPTDRRGKLLCASHFTAKYGINVARSKELWAQGIDPMTYAGKNFEVKAIHPDGRGYNLKSVGSGHLMRNLNIDDVSVALALNMTQADVQAQRLRIIQGMYSDVIPSKENILQIIQDALGED